MLERDVRTLARSQVGLTRKKACRRSDHPFSICSRQLPVHNRIGRSCGREGSNKVSTLNVSWDVVSQFLLTTSHVRQLWLQLLGPYLLF